MNRPLDEELRKQAVPRSRRQERDEHWRERRSRMWDRSCRGRDAAELIDPDFEDMF